MPILSYSPRTYGLCIQSDSGWLLLSPYTASTIRVRYNQNGAFSLQPGLAVVSNPGSYASYKVIDTDTNLAFSTACLTILIDRKTLAFTYLDGHGNLLTREPPRGGKNLEPIEVYVSDFEGATTVNTRESADGVRIDAQNVQKVFNRRAFHTKLEFEWADGEALYGLGQHEEGMFNLRGQHQYLYQQNMKVAIPVLLSTRGYGIYLDCFSLMTFHDDAFGSYLWSDVADELDYYFVYGPEFDSIIAQLRQLTGRAPMLPKWAFGYIQSKERYTSQEVLLAVAQEYRLCNLPLDCIVLDWKSWPGDLWGQKSLDPARFPRPDQMITDLHDLHTHIIISIWPIMSPGPQGENWKEMHRLKFLLGNQATYNAFDAAARACYWQQTNAGLFSHGFDGWWCDCTEPFETDWKGPVKPEPEERIRINTEEAKKYLDPEFINAYSLLHSQGIYEGQRQVNYAKRVLNLTRSASLGQQRYSTVTWSGDVTATWDTLRRQIADGLNFCATGMPYWNTDIGGYFVQRKPELWFWNGDYNQGVEDLGYRELYVRWFQFGAFSPIFRAHGTDTPREIWRFGNSGEPFYEALVRYLRLRYRLLPYIYSLAGQVTHQDGTLLRALPFDFRHDPNTYGIGDEYMFGPAFLVCPVTRPMYFAANSVKLEGVEKTRSVYLPSGSDWYDFWTGERCAGGQTILADAPLETMPLYVRSGSILPIGPEIQFTGEQPDAPIELWVYPGQDGAFTLYEDEGDNYNYEEGKYALIHMDWNDSTRRLTLDDRQGSYPGMQGSKIFRVVMADKRAFDPLAAEATQACEILYDGRRIMIEL
ncbi:MAG TPA: TIM-barrel domain-containing protein [Anaerolineaceae bacterium]|nr:TIM-barrel domain-containing protein [Anaerolineaceae bacterium]